MFAQARRLVGWSAAAGVLLIWSFWVVISRHGVEQTLTVYDILALRFLVASLAVAPLLVRYWPRNLALWQVCFISLGPGVPYLLFALTGMQFAPASHAGILMNGALPIFSALLGWAWLKDRPSLQRSIGMAVILMGCAVIGLSSGGGEVSEDAWIGHLLFLAAACVFAAYLAATKRWAITPLEALVSIPIINLLWFAPLYLFVLPKRIDAAPLSEILLQGLYQGLGPAILGVLCFTIAVGSIGPTLTAVVLAGVPGLATLLAIPLLGEWPDSLVWFGLVLASVGIVITAGWMPWMRPAKPLLRAAE